MQLRSRSEWAGREDRAERWVGWGIWRRGKQANSGNWEREKLKETKRENTKWHPQWLSASHARSCCEWSQLPSGRVENASHLSDVSRETACYLTIKWAYEMSVILHQFPMGEGKMEKETSENHRTPVNNSRGTPNGSQTTSVGHRDVRGCHWPSCLLRKI